jgi:hypothetical protein
MERKTGYGFFTRKTPDQGQADIIFTTYGILDLGHDIGMPGMFDFSQDTPQRVKFLDQHNTTSSLSVIGKILALRDLGRSSLPSELRARYPEATGGALASVQYLLNVPEGAGAYARAAVGLAEFSYGYDTLESDYVSMAGPDGKAVKARRLKRAKLFEVSQCIWGMNPATGVISTKAAGGFDVAQLERDLAAVERQVSAQEMREMRMEAFLLEAKINIALQGR